MDVDGVGSCGFADCGSLLVAAWLDVVDVTDVDDGEFVSVADGTDVDDGEFVSVADGTDVDD